MASLNLRLGLALTSLHDGDRAAADRLQRHRHTRATLDDQKASRFYEHLSGTVDSPEPVTIDSIATVTDHLGLRKVGRARLTSGRAAAGGTTRPWKARVPSRALTGGRAALVLIGRDQSGGEMIIALKTGVEAEKSDRESMRSAIWRDTRHGASRSENLRIWTFGASYDAGSRKIAAIPSAGLVGS
ncbi:hypothetical protein [Aeromicrobium sp. UC242_57]|uniref:hypothetical protein n=1 Tax=Aeromicrobium sp. UC242_57 TaxID=3374624 RepID=UPI00378FC3B9